MRRWLTGVLALLVLGLVVLPGVGGKGLINTAGLPTTLKLLMGTSGAEAREVTVGQHYRVPDGFTLSLYKKDLPRARMLRFTPAGDLLVSRPRSGDIVLLRRDQDGDGQPDETQTVIEGLRRPQGMDFAGDWLYVAESSRIGRIRFDHATGRTSGAYEVIVDGLTDNGNHWSKTLRIGPDGMLYLAQGSTCNVCEEKDPRRATIMRFQSDGSDAEIYATGLRNSVGFDWTPWSGDLYATENGRDRLGDDFPPCELNHIEQSSFYGWPFFHGDNVPDPELGADPLTGQREPVPPAHSFRAHNAPLGITFPDTENWPGDFDRIALVALHGSWNRSSPDGYKVVSLHWTDKGIEERDFLSGFYFQGKVSGRPVDVAQGPDGAIYVSDDFAGAIYRVNPGEAPGSPTG
jgi:glucose/arabinose dehydrogenase